MIKHMKRNLAAGAACAVALGLLVAPQAAVATGAGTAAADANAAAPGLVNILNFNDFHGRLQAPSGTSADPTPRGGTVGFAGTIEQLRAEYGDEASLLLAAGDSIGATLYASASQDDTPTLEVLNALEVDASATGNHEFDDGIDDLQGRVRDTADFPYLAANVSRDGAPIDDGFALFQTNGVSVAVIGAVTLETPTLVDPSGIEGVAFTDPVTAVNEIAAQLSDGNAANGEAELIIAEYHEGSQASLALNAPQDVQTAALTASMAEAEAFRAIVEDTAPAVDVIFNGHTHRPYSWLAPAPAGSEQDVRPVVQSGQYGENISQVVAVIDPVTGAATFPTVQNVARTTMPAADLIAAYPRVAAVDTITDAALEQAEVIGNEPLGEITADITTAFVGGARDDRSNASTLGTLVGNMLRDQLSSELRGGADIGITNPGGLRDELYYEAAEGEPEDGIVTVGEAAAVLPFANNLWTTTLTGAQLKVVLEQQWQPAGASRTYLQLGLSDNVKYTYDSTRPEGQRITGIFIDESPVSPTDEFRVAAPSFLIAGGDNFTGFTAGTNPTDSGLVDSEAFGAYIEARSPISPDFARRQLEIVGLPTAPVAVGTELSLTVNKVDLTSLGTPTSTEIELYHGDVLLGTFPVTANSATVTFDAPLPKGRALFELRSTATGTRVSFALPIAFESDRIAGVDRFATAVELSESAYPDGADVVYVASGENWPDGLAAGPAAAHEGGPLLLVRKGEAPEIVLDEIERLGAARVVIVGGEPTISTATQAQIDALETVTVVDRVAGDDRYETAQLIADYAFETASGAYMATGRSFPDALSAGAAAGHLDWPLLLVDPDEQVPAATLGSLDALGAGLVRIAGSSATVPSSVAGEVVDAGFTVSRLGGVDRFATSAIITASAFDAPVAAAYLVSGENYPDALPGAAVAGATDVPMLITRSQCVPERVHAELERLQVSSVWLIGGEPTLSPEVESLTDCG